MSELYGLNGSDAREFIAQISDVSNLRALLLEEKDHPKFEGGRSGVISAIEKQIAEISEAERQVAEAAKPPPPVVRHKVVVGNLSDDRGDPIAKGTPVSIGAPPPGGIHLSPEKFRFYQRIGGIEEVRD